MNKYVFLKPASFKVNGKLKTYLPNTEVYEEDLGSFLDMFKEKGIVKLVETPKSKKEKAEVKEKVVVEPEMKVTESELPVNFGDLNEVKKIDPIKSTEEKKEENKKAEAKRVEDKKKADEKKVLDKKLKMNSTVVSVEGDQALAKALGAEIPIQG